MSSTAFAKTLVLAAFFGAALSGSAFARDQIVSARLAQPAEQTRLIADSSVWTCEADSCVARTSHDATVRTCRQFVREAGIAVTSFGPEGGQLTEEELSQCNEGVASATEQARN